MKDAKFWMGLVSVFVVPTLIFAHAQGEVAKAIEILGGDVSVIRTKVESMESHIYDVDGVSKQNSSILQRFERDVSRIDVAVSAQGNKISAIEAVMPMRNSG